MVKKILNRKKLNPAVAEFTGKVYSEEISYQLFKYNLEGSQEVTDYDSNEFIGFPKDNFNYWLNTHGIHNAEEITKICNTAEIHNLVIQDILDIHQRPKFQDFENYWFFTIKSILPAKDSGVEQEQLSFILGKNFLISFQEKKADYFNHIRDRLRKNIGIIRDSGPDYLLFLLLEAILDNYFKTISTLDNKIENLALIDINSDPSPNTLNEIELYKKQLHQIKKTIIPIKEFVTRLEREEFGFVHDKHIKYYYELRDLCMSLIDDCEHLEVRLESSTNLFFSIQGHRMNQVMKTLTVVATIFIPLTFIAGIYGMNFSYMPELGWKWGYFGVWGIIIVVLAGMLYYFKRKNWF